MKRNWKSIFRNALPAWAVRLCRRWGMKLEVTPAEMADIACRDVHRQTSVFYTRAGRLQPARLIPPGPYNVSIQHRGPNVCLKQDFGSFKASYCIADDSIGKLIVPALQGNDHRLVLQFKHHSDGGANKYGDYGWHEWTILSK